MISSINDLNTLSRPQVIGYSVCDTVKSFLDPSDDLSSNHSSGSSFGWVERSSSYLSYSLVSYVS
jgi:hypothetical protein